MKHPINVALALFLAIPARAIAAPETSSLEALALQRDSLSIGTSYRLGPEPGTAFMLSAVLPSAVTLVGLPLGPLGFAAAALTTGAGHFYAGDPGRGVLVSLGGLLASGLGMGLGLGVGLNYAQSNPVGSSIGLVAWSVLIGGAVSTLGYAFFAGADAYHTAERQGR